MFPPSFPQVDSSEEIVRRRRFKARRFPPSAASLSSSLGSSADLDHVNSSSHDGGGSGGGHGGGAGVSTVDHHAGAAKLSPQTPRRRLLSPKSIVDDGTSSDDGGLESLVGEVGSDKRSLHQQPQQREAQSSPRPGLPHHDAGHGREVGGGAVKWVPKDRASARRQRRFSSDSLDDAERARAGRNGDRNNGSASFGEGETTVGAAPPHRGGQRNVGIRAIQAMRKEFRVKSPSDSDSDLLLSSGGATIADPAFVAKHILLSRSHDKLHSLTTSTTTPPTTTTSTFPASNDEWSSDAASPRRSVSSSSPTPRRNRCPKKDAGEFSLSGDTLSKPAPTTPRGLAPLGTTSTTRRSGAVNDPFVGKPLLGGGGGGAGGEEIVPGPRLPRSVTAKRREERETLLGTGLWEANAEVRGRRGGKDWSVEKRIDSSSSIAMKNRENGAEEEEEEEDPFKTKVR